MTKNSTVLNWWNKFFFFNYE